MPGDNSLIIKINGSAKNFLDEIEKVNKATKDTQKILSTTAKVASAAFVALTGSIAAVTKAYADYETALVGVGKTTNIAGKDLKNFGKEVQDLSKRIPLSTNELLGIAQAAGQLGVQGEENLLKFTETVAKLGVATDLSGEQAAIALARILTVTKESIGTIDVFGSVIVALGNNFAATESEIVKMTTEVARSTAVFNVSSAEAAGLATALKSVGVRAELGGSTVGRAFRAIDKALREGGAQMRALERLTGQTGDQLKKTFEEDSVAVFQTFIEGLQSLDNAGGDTTKALAQFGLKGEEVLKVLPVLAKNSELVGRALNTAAKEVKNATALNEEAAKAFNTLNSKAVLLKNSVITLATSLGERFAKDAASLVSETTKLVENLNSLDDATKDNIATGLKWLAITAGIVAALATTGLAVIKAVAAWKGLLAAFAAIKVAAVAVGAVITGGVVGPILAVIGVVGGAIFAVKKLVDTIEESKKLPSTLEKVSSELEAQKTLVDQLTESAKKQGLAENEIFKKNLENQKKKLAALEEQKKKLEELAGIQPENFVEVRPTAGGADPLDFNLPGEVAGPQVNAPLAADPAAREAEVAAELEAVKKAEDQKGQIIDEAAQKRVDARRTESEQLKNLLFQQSATEVNNLNEKEKQLLAKEFEFKEQRAQLKLEEQEAKNISDVQERAVALQNLELKNQILNAKEAEFTEMRAAVKAEEREREIALQAELRELDVQERQALNEQDLEMLRGQLQTEQEADRAHARNKMLRQAQVRKQEQKDTREHGATIAAIKKFMNSQEVQGVERTTSDLAQLRNSSNKKMAAIGKAAARANAAIQTANGAINAYTSLSIIPIVGPALGIAAAAALVAYGVEQQRNISQVQAASGGVIPNLPGQGGMRDRVTAMLEPGEVVVPNRLAPDFIQSVGRPETPDNEVPEMNITIGFKDNAFDLIEADRNEKVALGLIQG